MSKWSEVTRKCGILMALNKQKGEIMSFLRLILLLTPLAKN